jgi:hypothetical protein
VSSSPKKGTSGRGKLGLFKPLIGKWIAESSSPRGPFSCTRTFASVLGGKYIQLVAEWKFGPGTYQEIAYFGAGKDGKLQFWSFTSDGKHSEGKFVDVTDIGKGAFGFEAQMPAGTARMAYWLEDDDSFGWVVESKNKSGWKRFTEHHYRKMESFVLLRELKRKR